MLRIASPSCLHTACRYFSAFRQHTSSTKWMESAPLVTSLSKRMFRATANVVRHRFLQNLETMQFDNAIDYEQQDLTSLRTSKLPIVLKTNGVPVFPI